MKYETHQADKFVAICIAIVFASILIIGLS